MMRNFTSYNVIWKEFPPKFDFSFNNMSEAESIWCQLILFYASELNTSHVLRQYNRVQFETMKLYFSID